MGKLWGVVKGLAIPVAGGVVYGLIASRAGQAPIDSVTAGGVAFFCLLAVQRQILRAAPAPVAAPAPAPIPASAPAPSPGPSLPAQKEQPVAETADDFISLKSGIEELKQHGALADPDRPDDGQKALFKNLARSPAKRAPVEALAPKQLLELKMSYQAVLNAAVNFEREVRRRANVAGAKTLPLARLFAEPQFKLSKAQIQQLDTLRRVRNSILHGFETFVDPIEAEELVAAYDKAASWFEPAKDAEPQKV
jgi:hypothetical protein